MGTLHQVHRRSGRLAEKVSEPAVMARVFSTSVENLVNRPSPDRRAKIIFFATIQMKKPWYSAKNSLMFLTHPQKGGLPYERSGWFRRDDFAIECPSDIFTTSCAGDGWRGESLGIMHCC